MSVIEICAIIELVLLALQTSASIYFNIKKK